MIRLEYKSWIVLIWFCTRFAFGQESIHEQSAPSPPELHESKADHPARIIDFKRDVRPILSNRCFACHGPDEEQIESGLRLDSYESATSPADSGLVAIVPGKAIESELVRRILSRDDSERMPPPHFGESLSPDEVSKIQAWIDSGAEYAKHWSFDSLQNVDFSNPVHIAGYEEWNAHPIDHLLLRSLAQKSWQPSRQADLRTLLRRVAYDLVGLPPTPEEIEGLLERNDPSVYEEWVDQLLASPAFGEHWARKWLDLARYADSAGYADDPKRTIWAYRDWVIRAINDGMPFDQFTVEQLAGDLLPNPTDEQLIATAFHRNTMTNNEGGTNDEEFRNVAVVDRVNTTMSVWMGLTMACAQCHSHKFDPISHKEYFEVFAIFNQTEDADRSDESPIHSLWTTEQIAQKSSLQSQVELLETEMANNPDDPMLLERKQQLTEQLAGLKPSTTVPIMRELSQEKARKSFVHLRGNYREHGEVVTPGLPSALHAYHPGTASTVSVGQTPVELNRLDLAYWLMQPDNPLTARVIANRYWEDLFGVGIVRTSEEFGSQGDLPTHPELLDFLASELIRFEWDTKRFLRMLVLSSAYRQTSSVTPERFEEDPENIWLSRGPRFRASAEVIRDSSLAVAGLLSQQMYGPPTRPPQPALGLTAAFGSRTDWEASQGADRYRRGIYTQWRRSNPYPSMATFDAPNREVCILKRDRTNTPLQALVTLNDPVFLEAAQALARRVTIHKINHPIEVRSEVEVLSNLFVRVLARPPRDEELESLLKLRTKLVQALQLDPDQARMLATDPLGPVSEEIGVVELAAWTAISNVLLNLDEFLMKP